MQRLEDTQRRLIAPKVVVSEELGRGLGLGVELDCGGENDLTNTCQTGATTDSDSVGPFRVGQIVGEAFEITGVLGFGGMGVVYDAFDRLLLRRVAIKAPRYPMFAAALRAEAQGLSAIRSSGFVRVHAFMHFGGVDFMVMERLFGETLDTRLHEIAKRGERLSVTEVLELLIPITRALSKAHRAGVAQRDLKPSNIMVCGSRIVLIDLGLFIPEIMVGPENVPAGSIEYMSPEVLLGDVQRGQGPLIDLYALGILAYELLTNHTPFATGAMNKTLLNHLSAPIPDVRQVRADVPLALAGLISELLAKNPKDRPPSAESVLWQLMDVQDNGQRRPSLNILAIDDEAHVGRALKRSLESAFPKLRVETTTDPTQALPAIGDSTARPDVILVDLNMPTHNGIEICMSLLALPADQRPVVVAMSAEARQSDIDVLRALGVRHFVPKDSEFVASMSNVIGHLRDEHGPSSRPNND